MRVLRACLGALAVIVVLGGVTQGVAAAAPVGSCPDGVTAAGAGVGYGVTGMGAVVCAYAFPYTGVEVNPSAAAEVMGSGGVAQAGAGVYTCYRDGTPSDPDKSSICTYEGVGTRVQQVDGDKFIVFADPNVRVEHFHPFYDHDVTIWNTVVVDGANKPTGPDAYADVMVCDWSASGYSCPVTSDGVIALVQEILRDMTIHIARG